LIPFLEVSYFAKPSLGARIFLLSLISIANHDALVVIGMRIDPSDEPGVEFLPGPSISAGGSSKPDQGDSRDQKEQPQVGFPIDIYPIFHGSEYHQKRWDE
jgi:hypothetical protein